MERRLTTIEGWLRFLAGAVVVGAVLMAGPLTLLTIAIVFLTRKVGHQNGRVGKLEEEWGAHKRDLAEMKPYERLKAIEDALFAMQNYAKVGRYFAIVMAAGIALLGGPNVINLLGGQP